ncbi:MAG: hypothetical protein ACR2RB_22250 [Gammaproteobacteria bacterium]
MATEVQKEALHYFQMHGLKAQPPEALNEAMVRAIGTMRRSLYAESAGELTQAEASVLRSGGAVLEEQPGPDPMADAAAEYAALLRTSLSTTGAAERLKVNVSRIRQMLGNRTLYGVLVDGRWQIPEFQFQDEGLIPNIGKVNAVLDPELHPVAVYRWYTLPEADLETVAGQTLSPLAWLKGGFPVEPVVRAASDI